MYEKGQGTEEVGEKAVIKGLCSAFVADAIVVVLVIFLIAEAKYPMPNVTGGKFYCSSWFSEVSVHNWLVSRQGGMVEGYRRGETVHGVAGRRQEARDGSSPLCVPCILSRLPDLWAVALTPSVGYS